MAHIEPTQEQPRIPVETIGIRVYRARKSAGMEVGELAEATGIARSTISNYENEHTRPSKSYIKLIAMATGVDRYWLWDGSVPGDQRDPSTKWETTSRRQAPARSRAEIAALPRSA